MNRLVIVLLVAWLIALSTVLYLLVRRGMKRHLAAYRLGSAAERVRWRPGAGTGWRVLAGAPTVKQRAYYEALAEVLGMSPKEAWRVAIRAGGEVDPLSSDGRLASVGHTFDAMTSHDAAHFIAWLRARAYRCLRGGPGAARPGYLRRIRGVTQ
jgi:hypothetical protein